MAMAAAIIAAAHTVHTMAEPIQGQAAVKNTAQRIGRHMQTEECIIHRVIINHIWPLIKSMHLPACSVITV